MSEISRGEVPFATMREQVDLLMSKGASFWDLLRIYPFHLSMLQEFQDLVAQAAPLYKEMHSSVPFYANLPLDDPFWHNYIGSRVVQARQMVERHRRLTASCTAASSETSQA